MMTFEMQILALAFYSESVCMHACIYTDTYQTNILYFYMNEMQMVHIIFNAQIANNR